jgi:hypothetical protein
MYAYADVTWRTAGMWRYAAADFLRKASFLLTISCKQERPTGMVPSFNCVSCELNVSVIFGQENLPRPIRTEWFRN